MAEDQGMDDDWEGEEDLLESCPYGFEFCEDPFTKDTGQCTFACKIYLDSLKAEAKEEVRK